MELQCVILSLDEFPLEVRAVFQAPTHPRFLMALELLLHASRSGIWESILNLMVDAWMTSIFFGSPGTSVDKRDSLNSYLCTGSLTAPRRRGLS
jgi:hypothetical protein